jgi:hypothetical protein
LPSKQPMSKALKSEISNLKSRRAYCRPHPGAATNSTPPACARAKLSGAGVSPAAPPGRGETYQPKPRPWAWRGRLAREAPMRSEPMGGRKGWLLSIACRLLPMRSNRTGGPPPALGGSARTRPFAAISYKYRLDLLNPARIL